MTSRVMGLAVCLSLLAGCPAGRGEPDDASMPGPDAPSSPPCESDDACDDGLACNGVERCLEGRCAAGQTLRCDDGVACTSDRCSEDFGGCVYRPIDADGDGAPDAACLDTRGVPLGTDCDDDDASVFPGALEICDAAGRDEDCDPRTLGGVDGDGDGFIDARCCNGATCGDDCNDAVTGARPGGVETCNGIDDDCDGDIDEGLLITVYRDADGDGRGDPSAPTLACASTAGHSVYGDDCDDTSAARSPVLPEVCDGIDNDCDGVADPEDAPTSAPWYRDADGDGFGDPAIRQHACAPPTGYVLLGTDCDDTRAAVHPAQPELCNGRDDDCNGAADFLIAVGDYEDDDGDGVADAACVPTPSPADCDDRNRFSVPNAPERCDGRDNDCDGRIDEAVASIVYFRDLDGDGWGSTASGSLIGCTATLGYTTRGGDCDDASAARYPLATERCNGLDDDCDATVDESPASSLCGPRDGLELTCTAGRCRATGCTMGLGDCDGVPGCETSLSNDLSHCGRCDVSCVGDGVTEVGTCALGACHFRCVDGRVDCNGDIGMGGDGCESEGACSACPGGCALDEDCLDGTCVPCMPVIIPRAGALAPSVPVELRVYCVEGPASFIETDCPVVQCGRLSTWPHSYLDNRFSLGLSTHGPDGTHLFTTELFGPRYVYAASIDETGSMVMFRGQDDAIGAMPLSTFRLP